MAPHLVFCESKNVPLKSPLAASWYHAIVSARTRDVNSAMRTTARALEERLGRVVVELVERAYSS